MSGFDGSRRMADAALEIPVLPGWTSVGYRARRRMWDWAEPAPGSMAGSWALVTGGTAGIGRAGAEGLARAGAGVVIVGRDADRNARAAQEISADTGAEVIDLAADLVHLDEARRLADEVAARLDRVDVVVHNAGALFAEYQEVGGIERTVALHVLSPFVLTRALVPAIPNSTRSRVVFVSSGGMYTQRLDVSKLDAGPGGYRGPVAYARAKRAQVALARQWGHRLPGRAVHAMHPGWVDTASLEESLPRFARVMKPVLRQPEEGADTLVWLCSSPAAGTTTGLFWLDRRPRRESMLLGASSAAEEDRLWEWCEERTAGF